MGVIRYKIWHDLWATKGRTFQVVLIIAIGTFAIGSIMGGSRLLREDITKLWMGVTPPMIGMWIDPGLDTDMVKTIEKFDEVEDAEAWLETRVQWRATPDEAWQIGTLVAREDYENQRIYTINRDAGEWPIRRMMAFERGHPLEMGQHVELKIDDKEVRVDLGGILYNAKVAPVSFGGDPVFYTTRTRFEELTGWGDFNFLVAVIDEYSPEKAISVADKIETHLEKQDITIDGGLDDGRTGNPSTHFIQDELDGVFFLLTVLAAISLILGLFLVYNTITAIISQQTNQIGIMKAIGADFYQVLLVYFGQVFTYALLALAFAIPFGLLGAHGLRVFLIDLFNMEPGPIHLYPEVVLVQVAVAMLSPLLVTIIPIIIGARITVREAVSNYGLGTTAGVIERLLLRAKFIPQMGVLTIGNTFRNKGRVFVTQLTLVGSGMVFMMVMNTQASLFYTYSDVIFSIYDLNVRIAFQTNERIQAIETLAYSHPEVTAVEMLGFADATIRPQGQIESSDDQFASLAGFPVPTQTYNPKLRAGRWLEEGDTYALVINQKLADKIGVQVGDWVTLQIGSTSEQSWQIVGEIFEPFDEDAAYGPRSVVLQESRQIGRASRAWIQTKYQDAESEARVAKELLASI